MYKFSLAVVSLILLSLVLSGCSSKKVDTSKLTGKEVFEMKCSQCHNLPLITTYNGEAWIPTVMRMQAKSPLWIDDNEAKKIQEYLISISKTK